MFVGTCVSLKRFSQNIENGDLTNTK